MLGEVIFARWSWSGLGHWAVAGAPVALSPARFGLCGGLIDSPRSISKISRTSWYAWGFGVARTVPDQLEEYPVVDREPESHPVGRCPDGGLPAQCAAISAGFRR
jgi:hypothetical protein